MYVRHGGGTVGRRAAATMEGRSGDEDAGAEGKQNKGKKYIVYIMVMIVMDSLIE